MGNYSGYIISHGTPSEAGMKWDNPPSCDPFPTKIKLGALGLKREKKELICLIGDGPGAELLEFCRIPFADTTVTKCASLPIRAGPRRPWNSRLTDIKVLAEQITPVTPDRDLPFNWFWLLAATALLIAAAGGYLVYRRQKTGSWPWSDD